MQLVIRIDDRYLKLELSAMAGSDNVDACDGREGVLGALKDFDEEDISLLLEEQVLQQELVKIRKSLMFDSMNIRSLSSEEKSKMNDRLSQVFQEMAALAAKKAQVLESRVASMLNIIDPVGGKDETSKRPASKRTVRLGDRSRRRTQPGLTGERHNNVCLSSCLRLPKPPKKPPFE